jgi:hypothetical protein
VPAWDRPELGEIILWTNSTSILESTKRLHHSQVLVSVGMRVLVNASHCQVEVLTTDANDRTKNKKKHFES